MVCGKPIVCYFVNQRGREWFRQPDESRMSAPGWTCVRFAPAPLIFSPPAWAPTPCAGCQAKSPSACGKPQRRTPSADGHCECISATTPPAWCTGAGCPPTSPNPRPPNTFSTGPLPPHPAGSTPDQQPLRQPIPRRANQHFVFPAAIPPRRVTPQMRRPQVIQLPQTRVVRGEPLNGDDMIHRRRSRIGPRHTHINHRRIERQLPLPRKIWALARTNPTNARPGQHCLTGITPQSAAPTQRLSRCANELGHLTRHPHNRESNPPSPAAASPAPAPLHPADREDQDAVPHTSCSNHSSGTSHELHRIGPQMRSRNARSRANCSCNHLIFSSLKGRCQGRKSSPLTSTPAARTNRTGQGSTR